MSRQASRSEIIRALGLTCLGLGKAAAAIKPEEKHLQDTKLEILNSLNMIAKMVSWELKCSRDADQSPKKKSTITNGSTP